MMGRREKKVLKVVMSEMRRERRVLLHVDHKVNVMRNDDSGWKLLRE